MKIYKFCLIFFSIMFIGCSPLKKYYGKYYCENETNAINYLIIKEDNSYFHYYKKDNIEISQTGTWLYLDDRFERIELIDFNNYNENGEKYSIIKNYILIKNNNYLNNGFDGNTRSSFIKR
ncbi:hypothetical protein [Flavobacterium sp.]|uniref:hypothetical protein n=1 Tax=Flavobacterium sp. TaxID=239 RepID=UPI002608E650|nr:hypothetical protein [Flavobacterium sp.]